MNRTPLTIIMLLLLATTARSSAQQPTDDRELQEVVVLGAKHKQRSLTSRGTRIPGAVSMFTPDKVGYEVGSALNVKHPFELREITFDILSNKLKGATLQVAIYRDSTFAAVFPHPIPVSLTEGKRQSITVAPTELTLLEPGNYIVGITFADCDAETLQQWSLHEQWDAKTRYQMMEQHIEFPLYLKAGYIRSTATDTFERCAASIGLKVRGTLCR